MSRQFAGILGLIAFCSVLGRGLMHGASDDGTILSACAAMFSMAAVGFILATFAAWIVDQSNQTQLSRSKHLKSTDVGATTT